MAQSKALGKKLTRKEKASRWAERLVATVVMTAASTAAAVVTKHYVGGYLTRRALVTKGAKVIPMKKAGL